MAIYDKRLLRSLPVIPEVFPRGAGGSDSRSAMVKLPRIDSVNGGHLEWL